jgi:hypothetical protein
MIIEDQSQPFPLSALGTRWQVLTDQVMGGVSRGQLTREIVDGREALRLRGDVSLANDGGFVQMALDLSPGGAAIDVSRWGGIELTVRGEDEAYGLHLRTADLLRPWESYRQGFRATSAWQTLRLPFSGFAAHRTEIPLDLRRLRRLGLVAIGRAFAADLALADLRLV